MAAVDTLHGLATNITPHAPLSDVRTAFAAFSHTPPTGADPDEPDPDAYAPFAAYVAGEFAQRMDEFGALLDTLDADDHANKLARAYQIVVRTPPRRPLLVAISTAHRLLSHDTFRATASCSVRPLFVHAPSFLTLPPFWCSHIACHERHSTLLAMGCRPLTKTVATGCRPAARLRPHSWLRPTPCALHQRRVPRRRRTLLCLPPPEHRSPLTPAPQIDVEKRLTEFLSADLSIAQVCLLPVAPLSPCSPAHAASHTLVHARPMGRSPPCSPHSTATATT